MTLVGGVVYRERELQVGEALPKGALILPSDGYFDMSGNPISGEGLSSHLASGDVSPQPALASNPYATGPLPLTEADVRRIVREEIARALETLKKGQST